MAGQCARATIAHDAFVPSVAVA